MVRGENVFFPLKDSSFSNISCRQGRVMTRTS